MSARRTTGANGIATRSAAFVVAANMIGAGVFTTSGFALADLGRPSIVLLAWFVGGVIALCGALSYARLARRWPGNGGEYLFLSRSLHPLAGFLAGWVSLLAGFTAPIAVAAHGLEAYWGTTLEEVWGVHLPTHSLGAVAIVLCGIAHGRARETGLRLQDWAVGIKLAAILGFIVFGAARLGLGLVESTEMIAQGISLQPAPSLSAFAVTLVWIGFAYSGWNAAVYLAGELEAPETTLPRALLAGTAGVTLIYIALNAIFLASAPFEALAGRAEVGAIAASALGGSSARVALSVIVGMALMTSISAMVMVGPRVYAQMAEDGLFPKSLVSREGNPSQAIAVQVVLALLVLFVSDLRELLLYVGFLLGLSATATVACLWIDDPATPRAEMRGLFSDAMRDWVPPLVFVVATLGSAGFMVIREPNQVVAGLATLGVGLVAYVIFSRTQG